MAQITAALVKELREKSGVGMMDCKKALAENDGDLEASLDWLRTKGLATAQKKSGRVAAEGLVCVKSGDKAGAAVEINAETDFVGRNEIFQGFVETVTELTFSVGEEADTILAADYPGAGHSVQDELTKNIATIGENQSFRRAKVLRVNDGVVASYVHSALKPGVGKIGVLVALESTGDKAVLEGVGKQLAMHIAAANPAFLNMDSVDPEAVERERQVLTEQARESGRPEEIIAKMIEGRLKKYYKEVVLSEQTFMIDGETPISKVIENAGKDAGAAVEMTGFVRFELGEGIEKKEDDFAAEVAAAVQG